jgi:hypothetical protein
MAAAAGPAAGHSRGPGQRADARLHDGRPRFELFDCCYICHRHGKSLPKDGREFVTYRRIDTLFYFSRKTGEKRIFNQCLKRFCDLQKTVFFAVIQKLFFELEKRRFFGPAIPQAQRAGMFIVNEHKINLPPHPTLSPGGTKHRRLWVNCDLNFVGWDWRALPV